MLKGKVGRICFSRVPEGEDLLDAIKHKVEESGIKAGVLIAIGALKNATVGCFENGEYKNTRLPGPLEIASCMGNVATNEKGEVMIHAHIVISNAKGEAFGGHLMKDSHVGVTAELVIIEAGGISLVRAFDEKAKLNLLRLS
jgi:predicted DNA-binding protein with PD1-like motif